MIFSKKNIGYLVFFLLFTILLSGIVTILQVRKPHQYETFEGATDAASADTEAAAAEAAAKRQEEAIKRTYAQIENVTSREMMHSSLNMIHVYKQVVKDFDKVFSIDSVQHMMEQVKLFDLKKILDILIPKLLEEMHNNYDDLCLLTTEIKYLFIKLKTETSDLSDLDLPAEEQKRLTDDRKHKALQRYMDDKTRYSKQNGDKPIMECFANPEDIELTENTENPYKQPKQSNPDEDVSDEEKAAAAEKKKAAAEKDAKDKAAKLAASKLEAKNAPPKDAIGEKDVDAYIAIINEAMRSDLILEAKSKQAMIEATLGFNSSYFKKLQELKPTHPPTKKEGFENPMEGFENPMEGFEVEGFQSLSRAKFLALKLLKSFKPMIDFVEKHYDLHKKIVLQKEEVKKIKQEIGG